MSEPLRPPAVKAEDVLGPLEAEVMRILWSEGEQAVGAVQAALNLRRSPGLAYTTVMTILVRLHDKGLVGRRRDGRHYLYLAEAGEAELVVSSSRRAVDAVLARYGTAALRQFAIRLEEVDPAMRAELEKLAQKPEEA